MLTSRVEILSDSDEYNNVSYYYNAVNKMNISSTANKHNDPPLCIHFHGSLVNIKYDINVIITVIETNLLSTKRKQISMKVKLVTETGPWLYGITAIGS